MYKPEVGLHWSSIEAKCSRSEKAKVNTRLWNNGEDFLEGIGFLSIDGVLIGWEGEENHILGGVRTLAKV